jgi:hypothetical protein
MTSSGIIALKSVIDLGWHQKEFQRKPPFA